MKLLSDNIQKHITSAFLCLTALFCLALDCNADDIDPTDISYVSVNPYTNEVTVSWYKSESANIKFARILYIYEKTTLVKGKGFADILGNEDNSYVFTTDTIALFSFEADEVPLSLAVDAYSENGTNSTSLREYHTTMVASAKTTSCPTKIKISWTHYYGYEITVDKYEIIESSNGTETVVKECNANENSCLIDLNETQNRSFFVRATFNDCRGKKQISTSCMCEVSQKAPKLPQYLSIENITIEQNDDVSLTCKCDVSADFRTYIVYKSECDANHFTPIDTFNLSSSSSEVFKLTDTKAHKQDTILFYKIVAIDNCSNAIFESRMVQTPKINIQKVDETTNIIEWDKNAENVVRYKIWRSINGEKEECIDSVENDASVYIDNIDVSQKNVVSICYRVEIILENGLSSFSNSSCLNKDYKILIPNAFNPSSSILENTVFKPKYAFIDGEYSMKIFDRFGTCVFTSDDIDNGWDGKIRGNNAPTGMYHYKIEIILPNGTEIERHGAVQLIYK